MSRPGIISPSYGADALSNPAAGLAIWSSPDGKSIKLQKDDGTLSLYPTPSSDTHGAATASTLVTDSNGRVTLDGLNIGTLSGATAGQINASGAMSLNASGAAAPTLSGMGSNVLLQITGTLLPRVIIDSVYTNNSSSASIVLRAAGGTPGSPVALASGRQIGTVSAFGYGTTAYCTSPRAGIYFTTEEAWTDSAQGTRISLYTTAPGGIIISEPMRITGAGNVGINTVSPLAKLVVNGGLHVGADSDPGANNLLVDGTVKVAGAFGANGATPQTAYASGGAAPAGGTGTAAGGYDTSAHRDSLITLVNKMRTALVNAGIMS